MSESSYLNTIVCLLQDIKNYFEHLNHQQDIQILKKISKLQNCVKYFNTEWKKKVLKIDEITHELKKKNNILKKIRKQSLDLQKDKKQHFEKIQRLTHIYQEKNNQITKKFNQLKNKNYILQSVQSVQCQLLGGKDYLEMKMENQYLQNKIIKLQQLYQNSKIQNSSKKLLIDELTISLENYIEQTQINRGESEMRMIPRSDQQYQKQDQIIKKTKPKLNDPRVTDQQQQEQSDDDPEKEEHSTIAGDFDDQDDQLPQYLFFALQEQEQSSDSTKIPEIQEEQISSTEFNQNQTPITPSGWHWSIQQLWQNIAKLFINQ